MNNFLSRGFMLLLLGAAPAGIFAQVAMIKVEGGTFLMGGKFSTTLSTFDLSTTPITQVEYMKVVGANPSHFKGDNLPVENVSWYDALIFCNKLSSEENLTPVYTINGRTVTWNPSANGFRLPTEAEYQYAEGGGSGGSKTEFPGSNKADEVAWYDKNSQATTHPVGLKKANSLGFYDIGGDVWEWCWDWYDENLVGGSDPLGPREGSLKILCGGSWNSPETMVAVSHRSNAFPDDHDASIGFRVAKSEGFKPVPIPKKLPAAGLVPPSATTPMANSKK